MSSHRPLFIVVMMSFILIAALSAGAHAAYSNYEADFVQSSDLQETQSALGELEERVASLEESAVAGEESLKQNAQTTAALSAEIERSTLLVLGAIAVVGLLLAIFGLLTIPGTFRKMRRLNEAVETRLKETKDKLTSIEAFCHRVGATGVKMESFLGGIQTNKQQLESQALTDPSIFPFGQEKSIADEAPRYKIFLRRFETLESLNIGFATGVYATAARGYFAARDLESCLDCLDRQLAREPKNAVALANRAATLLELGQAEEAKFAFDATIETKADLPEAYYGKALSLNRLGRHEDELAAYNEALRLRPDYFAAAYSKALALGHLRRSSMELTAYDKLLRIKPDFAEAHCNRGVALGNLGRHEEALTAYDQALRLRPDYVEAIYNRGVALGNLERYEEELAAYDEAIRRCPDYAQAHYNRGAALSNLDRHQEEIAAYDRAIWIKPDYAEAHANKGLALANIGRYQEALYCFSDALRYNPNDAEAYYWRACAHSHFNHKDAAVADLKKAVSLNTDFMLEARKEVEFENLRGDSNFQRVLGL